MGIIGIRGLIGGCVMAGDGHKRLNRPNRRVVRWRVMGDGYKRLNRPNRRVCDGG